MKSKYYTLFPHIQFHPFLIDRTAPKDLQKATMEAIINTVILLPPLSNNN
jgi:hypothetical protein